MAQKFIIKTANEKYVSEIYFLNGLDFETLHEADAKKFYSKAEAEAAIKSNGWDENFVTVIKATNDNG